MKTLKSSKAAMAIAFASAVMIAGCGQNEETSEAAPEADTAPTSSAMEETPATTATDSITEPTEPQAEAEAEPAPSAAVGVADQPAAAGSTSPDMAGSEPGTGAAGAGITPPTSGESGASESQTADPQRY